MADLGFFNYMPTVGIDANYAFIPLNLIVLRLPDMVRLAWNDLGRSHSDAACGITREAFRAPFSAPSCLPHPLVKRGAGFMTSLKELTLL